MEELISDEHDIDQILDNRPERFAVIRTQAAMVEGMAFKQSRVDSLLWAYRDIGYLYADVNPLGESYSRQFSRLVEFQKESYHTLSLREFGLSEGDLDMEFFGVKFIS